MQRVLSRVALQRCICDYVTPRSGQPCRREAVKRVWRKRWRVDSSRTFSTSSLSLSQVDKFRVRDNSQSQEQTDGPSLPIEDHLFDILKDEDKETVSITKYFNLLNESGLRPSDPRLRESTQKILTYQRAVLGFDGSSESMGLDRETFKSCVSDNILLITRAFKNQFVIPEFKSFTKHIDEVYWHCKNNTNGKVAAHIPQLSKYSSDYWGAAVCTVDGQRHAVGDTEATYPIQSCIKPLMYALAIKENGADAVHQYVGQEPSMPKTFNEINLSSSMTPQRPQNPMLNSGAINITSLLKKQMGKSDRFDWIYHQFRRLAGEQYVGFDYSTFLSDREKAGRKNALNFYLKEGQCFPEGANLQESLDLYLQACATEINCDSGSVMAATLANGGICPITGDRVLDEEAVQNTLSLMHSCGMYDLSGQFAFKVGLPAKSCVSGCILVVVPNTMGICLWSPPLDETGNSFRGVQFCEELVTRFNFHHYDILQKYTSTKTDPRRRKMEDKGLEVVSLLFGAFNGDVGAMRRFSLKGFDMGQGDYDRRTALHLAAAEGHLEVVRFLLVKCKVNPKPQDRWGHTPREEAQRFGHKDVEELLRKFEDENSGS